MKTAHDLLVALARRYAFADVAALVSGGPGLDALTAKSAVRVREICAFGQRLLDLDAEDFGGADGPNGANAEIAAAVPPDLRARALLCRMPQSPDEQVRGALGSLQPAYALMLEVVAARWARRETAAVIATVHLASEYGPLLAWERALGHAGDPARLPIAVSGAGSAWGDFDDARCPHTKAEKSAARHALRVGQGDAVGWRAYLDRQHSYVAQALGVCAAECPRPCTVLTRLSTADEERVAAGCRLALSYMDSAVVRLRHASPIGHGFGVPSPAEVLEAWNRTRTSLGRLDESVLADDGFPLAGLSGLFTAIAGTPIRPDTLVAEAAGALAAELDARVN